MDKLKKTTDLLSTDHNWYFGEEKEGKKIIQNLVAPLQTGPKNNGNKAQEKDWAGLANHNAGSSSSISMVLSVFLVSM